MRLIDADVFEKFIKEKYKDGESTDDIKDQMLFDLSYQPTAYNVEKVVEQLEEAKSEDTRMAYCQAQNFKKPCGDRNCFECYVGHLVEIAKAGGNNDNR